MRSIVGPALALCLLPAAALPALAQDEQVIRLYVGPDVVECVGVAPQTCLLVSTEPDAEPSLFYEAIGGFEHTPGTSYVLDVLVEPVEDPPADASSLRYTLVEVVLEGPPVPGQVLRGDFLVVPDESFCRLFAERPAGCMAVLSATAPLGGFIPRAWADVLGDAWPIDHEPWRTYENDAYCHALAVFDGYGECLDVIREAALPVTIPASIAESALADYLPPPESPPAP